jgi:orotidine-5'-phosphate decarboxylase
MSGIIKAERSLIPALDLKSIRDLPEALTALQGIPFVKAIKIGFSLGLDNLKEARQMVREFDPEWKALYDHQKAGCDIPENGENYTYKMVEAKVDAAIVFPLGGAETEVAWVKELQQAGIPVIVGGDMTQEGFFVSQGGFVADDAPDRIFSIAAGMGVRDFFLPGTRPEKVPDYLDLLEKRTNGEDFDIFSCGYFRQGADPATMARLVRRRSHYVVGKRIYEAGGIAEMRAAAFQAFAQFQEVA